MTANLLFCVLLVTAFTSLECALIDLKKAVNDSPTDKLNKVPLIEHSNNNTRTKRQNSDLVRIILDSSNGYGLAKTGDAGTINQGAFNGAKNSQININTVNIPHGAQKGVTVNIVNVNNAGKKDDTPDRQPETNARIPQNYAEDNIRAATTEKQEDVNSPINEDKITQPETNVSGQGDEDRILFDESNNGFAIENSETANENMQNPNNAAISVRESANGFGSESSADLIQTTDSKASRQFLKKVKNAKLSGAHERKPESESRLSHQVSADNYWEGHRGEYEQFRKYGRQSHYGQYSDHNQHDNHGYPRNPYRFWKESSHDYFESF